MRKQLNHLDSTGAAHMVDVTKKKLTNRIAVAKCNVMMQKSTFKLFTDGYSEKGDVVGVARLAGIMAAKKTSEIIPLCHPLPLSKVSINFQLKSNPTYIEIEATVKTTGKTGVEMEALTAVSVSALTIYDMLKSVDKSIKITEICLTFKDGGKSGQYSKKDNA